MRRTVLILAAALVALASCSDDDVQPTTDAGPLVLDGTGLRDIAAGKDRSKPGPDQAPKPDISTAINEKEPNDGSTATELHKLTWPVAVNGAIGKAGDKDIFGIDVQAGDRLVARIKPATPLQPHLVIFDPKGKLPTVANADSKETFVEYYALKSAPLLLAVRDRRNVAKPPKNVGGKGFTYLLTIQRLKRPPVPVTVSVEKSMTLAPRGTVRVFSYTATKGLDMQLTVRAQQLSKPSDVDSRLSLFHPGQKIWAGTNDDASAGVKDSLLKGPMPASGTYHAIVENLKIDAADLRFSFRATTIK